MLFVNLGNVNVFIGKKGKVVVELFVDIVCKVVECILNSFYLVFIGVIGELLLVEKFFDVVG